MVAHRAHADLVLLEPRLVKSGPTEQKVGDVRDLLEGLYLTSLGGRRVCLIDDADVTLNTHGENTLLKVLEEPPPGLVFLLVAQRPGRLLRTVRSRCAQLRLAPLGDAEVADGLAALAPDILAEARRALAAAAEGSIGRALELHQGGWFEAYAELIRVLEPASGSEAALLRAMLALIRQTESRGLPGMVDLLGTLFRRLARHAAGRPPVDSVAGEGKALAGLAATRSLDRWLALWDKLAAVSGRVEALNLDPQPALLQIVFEACGAEPGPVLGPS